MKTFYLLVLAFSVSAFGSLCEKTETEKWTKAVKVDVTRFYYEDALDACTTNLSEHLTNLQTACEKDDDYHAVLRTLLQESCERKNCHYFGKPVSSWVCSISGPASCCK